MFVTKIIPLNIKLFDDSAFETANGNTTSNLSAEAKTFYVKELLENCRPNLVFAQFAKDYDIPSGSGKTLEFRRFTALAPAMTPIVEGVTPAATKLTMSTLSKNVAQYGAWTQRTDILDAVAIDKMAVVAIDELSAQAYKTLDTVIRNEVMGGTNVIYQPKIVSGASTAVTTRAGLDATATLTMNTILDGVRFLLSKDVPQINGEYICIVHPDVAMDLMKTDEWKDIHKYASPEHIYNGDLGKIGSVRFVQSTNAPVWAAGSTTGAVKSYGCLLFGADAFASTKIDNLSLDVIVKKSDSSDTSNPLNLYSTVGWKATQAAVRLAEERMVRIECTSTYQATAVSNAA